MDIKFVTIYDDKVGKVTFPLDNLAVIVWDSMGKGKSLVILKTEQTYIVSSYSMRDLEDSIYGEEN